MHVPGSMRSKSARIVAAVVMVAAIAGCGGSTEPDGGMSGEWDLALVEGQPVPAVYLVYGFGATKQVLDASLDFSGRRVVDARHLRDNPIGTDPSEFGDTTTFAYRVEDDLVIITRPNIIAAQTYSDTGLVDGSTIYLTVRTVDGTPNQRRLLTYVRRQ